MSLELWSINVSKKRPVILNDVLPTWEEIKITKVSFVHTLESETWTTLSVILEPGQSGTSARDPIVLCTLNPKKEEYHHPNFTFNDANGITQLQVTGPNTLNVTGVFKLSTNTTKMSKPSPKKAYVATFSEISTDALSNDGQKMPSLNTTPANYSTQALSATHHPRESRHNYSDQPIQAISVRLFQADPECIQVSTKFVLQRRPQSSY
ncbi:hypothetical protein GYMLUDRAFT_64057 [Collybiopsis luxurians FD-317 M1]|uniref:Nucleoplasmin-like domain-containing protein n=1 Tax=Collybiopsis luxurians FD-317 M1 TaxID=944289 RepID=A0A0D0C4P5_9AGAR|nr:hypothetical protein GYMLUDRAFT_64057 [Collybiopsis luxurians FD-317 M1]